MMSKKMVGIILIFIVIIFGLIIGKSIVETVEKGTYQVKQAAVTGKMSAKMTPGLWFQLFGDIEPWPKAETFFFTADKVEGAKIDQSIEVRYVDGSLCNISGTLRIVMPTLQSQAIALTTERGHKTYRDLEQKLILPTVRNVLRLTANLMTAKDSYSTMRADFITWARDQIMNGMYVTTSEERKIKDLISGEMVTKTFKVIKRDVVGNPIYQKNPLADTGILLVNFEIKKFVYEDKVNKQIATQQEALMAVATAKAKAQEAEQNKLTLEAQGKANVAKARYEEEQVKVRAVVVAQREKEVQVIGAEQRKDVAKLDKEAAELKKQEQILLGQGEAERKRLVLAADGALKQKLETYENVMGVWADAHSKRLVPTVIMGGSKGPTDGDSLSMSEVISLMAVKQLGLDFSIPKGTTISE